VSYCHQDCIGICNKYERILSFPSTLISPSARLIGDRPQTSLDLNLFSVESSECSPLRFSPLFSIPEFC
jgi:hypothetical protein